MKFTFKRVCSELFINTGCTLLQTIWRPLFEPMMISLHYQYLTSSYLSPAKFYCPQPYLARRNIKEASDLQSVAPEISFSGGWLEKWGLKLKLKLRLSLATVCLFLPWFIRGGTTKFKKKTFSK